MALGAIKDTVMWKLRLPPNEEELRAQRVSDGVKDAVEKLTPVEEGWEVSSDTVAEARGVLVAIQPDIDAILKGAMEESQNPAVAAGKRMAKDMYDRTKSSAWNALTGFIERNTGLKTMTFITTYITTNISEFLVKIWALNLPSWFFSFLKDYALVVPNMLVWLTVGAMITFVKTADRAKAGLTDSTNYLLALIGWYVATQLYTIFHILEWFLSLWGKAVNLWIQAGIIAWLFAVVWAWRKYKTKA